jgi:5'-nucleotidase
MIDKNCEGIVHVDMDEVLFDFDEAVIERWPKYLPQVERIDSNLLQYWNLPENYPPEYTDVIMSIWREEGFFRNLKPIEGAIDAINEMLDAGLKVFLCSTPTTQEPHCMYEKLQSIYQHFGKRLIDRVIFTKDKTVGAYGQYLIDDRPNIVGEAKPTWIHVHFDRGRQWGKTFKGPQLSDWSKWREVIK